MDTPLETLEKLSANALSRNAAFERFSTPSGRNLHKLYRRLTALLAEISQKDCLATLSSRGEGEKTLVVRIERMGYTRSATLKEWEAAFFLEKMGAARYLTLP